MDSAGRRTRLIQSSWPLAHLGSGAYGQGSESKEQRRFLYDNGPDMVAEYLDRNGDDHPDRVRIFWDEPAIDRKVGFIDIDPDDNSVEGIYYYITDHTGTVYRIVDQDGRTIEQYAYDAWGNLRYQHCTFSPGLDNRFRC